MKIVSYAFSERLAALLSSRFGAEFSNRSERLVPDTADPAADIAIITTASRADKETLSRMVKLRALVTTSAGMDNMDLEECRRRGIEVRNCPTYSANAVAELALALAFTGLRNLHLVLPEARDMGYPVGVGWGFELSGKTCAVLGTGNIGSRIARMLLGVGCTVVAFSRTSSKELVDAGVRYVPLEQALKSDLVFIALPNTSETYHLLDDSRLSMMEDLTALIVVSRGEIIDSTALLKHIDRLAFVATDVLEGQSVSWHGTPASLEVVKELLKKDNFIRSPYIGACTGESGERLENELVNTLSVLRQKLG